MCGSAILNEGFRVLFEDYINARRAMSNICEDLQYGHAEGIADVLDRAVASFKQRKKLFNGFSDCEDFITMKIKMRGIRENLGKGLLRD